MLITKKSFAVVHFFIAEEGYVHKYPGTLFPETDLSHQGFRLNLIVKNDYFVPLLTTINGNNNFLGGSSAII